MGPVRQSRGGRCPSRRAPIERRQPDADGRVVARQHRYPELHDPAWLRAEYESKAKSSIEIGRDLGAPTKTVLEALARAGIERRTAHLKRHHELRNSDWLRHQHVTLGRTSTAIGRDLGAHSSTVLDALERAGIPKRPGGGNIRFPQLRDETWLRQQYVVLGRTRTEIAQELGAVPRTVTRALKRHAIPIRARTST